MDILKNAVDSIVVGLEDYELASADERRVVSCTRNIFAGVLLLFKHKLAGIDERLIRQNEGKRTIGLEEIKEIFHKRDIKVDWKRIKKIRDFRNQVEHYYSGHSYSSARSLISNLFIVINQFIRGHLNEDPKELLGHKPWAIMIEVSEVYEEEKAECNIKLEKLEYFCASILDAFKEFSCEECGAGLINPTLTDGQASESDFVCKTCSYDLPYETIISSVISQYYDDAVYLSLKEGGDTPIIECPLGCDGLYLYEDGVCSSCGDGVEHKCQICGNPIPAEELFMVPYCGYCKHVMSKDD